MKKWILSLCLIGLLYGCGTGRNHQGDVSAPVHHLVVLHTNDTHGHVAKFVFDSAPGVGGLPARATLIRDIRERNRDVLLLDAGDINTGTPESNLFNAKPDIEGFNYVGYDAAVLGNHEFDHPVSVLREQMTWADFPFIAANIKTEDGRDLTSPFIIKEVGGVKVAIMGLTTKTTETIGNPSYVQGLVFEDEVEVARRLVPQLKEEADMVIALVHMGIYDSPERGSRRLASQVGGIDLIVDGHSHTRLEAPVFVKHLGSDHETMIVQAWKWGLILGRVDIWLQDKRIVDYKFEAIPVNLKRPVRSPGGPVTHQFVGKEIEEDGVLLALLQPYMDEAAMTLSEVIGRAKGTFFSAACRIQETPLGDIVADSMLWYTGYLKVDFAVQNGGGIRADLAAGPISKRSVFEVLPFENSVVVLTLKGSDLKSFFDHVAAIPAGAGAFPQVSEGVSFTINRLNGRCENISIKGRPVDPDRTYKIATNSYLAGGGDGCKMFLRAVDKYDSSMTQRDVFTAYIQFLGGVIQPEARQRITIINKATESLRESGVLHGEYRPSAWDYVGLVYGPDWKMVMGGKKLYQFG